MSSIKISKTPIPSDFKEGLSRVHELRCHDPFSVLGKHQHKNKTFVVLFSPETQKIELENEATSFKKIEGSDFFWAVLKTKNNASHYRVKYLYNNNSVYTSYDAYSFLPQLSEYDLHLFNEGKHWHAYRVLGGHPKIVDGISGVVFATWAPNAERVSVIGDFNHWDGRKHMMRSRVGTGVWEIFVPGATVGQHYKYEIRNSEGQLSVKSDPYAQGFEFRPSTASYVVGETDYQWQDKLWIKRREESNWLTQPMSTYELHLGSWKRQNDNKFINYRDIVVELVPYINELGFTHIELLPITEHPLDASWGYQTTGYFAPTRRFGNADDFRFFVDYCHQHNVGVILDWVPAHFPKDPHGLARYDGTPLYEHEDPRQGEHRDWGTLIFNYGRNEVKNFLISSAVYWLEEFHIDGLRVDAVASMLYLDYSREEWVPNKYGGRENLEAIDFLKELNTITHEQFPGTVTLAEESTDWPQVTRPVWLGGLGFSMKWNMGWMHDSLEYASKDPIYRHYHHDLLTFGLLYAFTENFILPFSHDEVVHLKGSMLEKMPGDNWQKYATLRLLYVYMFTYPGKKLLFMGSEFAENEEWNQDKELNWYLLKHPMHLGVKKLLADVNHAYVNNKALHYYEFEWKGFEWLDCHDASQSVLSYQRKYNNTLLLVILNFTPEPRLNYRLGTPQAGYYKEIINSDSEFYGGSNVGNGGIIKTTEGKWMNFQHSLTLTLPPLAGLVLEYLDGS
ncbi:MAG: 1,4-alpha-glucan branching protein GlgB [Methylococcales bacterium]|jgi:1,4-alpha-glucan branching enzyme|nr:1,4-alpha-glucan branching protein GlgB [Methylococcales bacterium]MBT7408139.1 1,4-alpha-glucan branching protein GlgB [Methylococcales bacterium]